MHGRSPTLRDRAALTLGSIVQWDSVGNSGGCQAIYTVYQAPNTTLADPPICRNLTYPQETQNLGIETASAAGNLSQFGWIDQVGSLFQTKIQRETERCARSALIYR